MHMVLSSFLSSLKIMLSQTKKKTANEQINNGSAIRETKCIRYLAEDVHERIRCVNKLERLKTKTMKAFCSSIRVILNRGILGTTVKRDK